MTTRQRQRSEFEGTYTAPEVTRRGRGVRFWVETVLFIALLAALGTLFYLESAEHNARVMSSPWTGPR